MERKAIFVSPKTHKSFKLLAVKLGLTFDQLLIRLLTNQKER
jgi:hypothetical protein